MIFWTCVGCSWICVRKSPPEISSTVYATFVLLFCILVFVHLVVIPISCELAEMMLYVVKVHKLKARISNAKRKCFSSKILLRQVDAVIPIRVWYGPFWCLGEEFVPEYLWMLVQRCFDAIMMIT